jgi:hypothetical protein
MAIYRNYLILTLAALLCLPMTLCSQETNGLSLLLENSLQNNPELGAAYHRWKATSAAVIHKAARSGY